MAVAVAATLEPDGPPSAALDLGAGGGVPGLVLAERWPIASFVLLDANRRRTDFLREAVQELGWGGRVRVVCERAELAGRDPDLRGSFDLVVARSFGPPAVTAECGAPFLSIGGHLAVAEPPAPNPADGVESDTAAVAVTGDARTATAGAARRWPAEGCAEFGLEAAPRAEWPVAVQILRQVRICPDRYPRRNGLPSKRPIF